MHSTFDTNDISFKTVLKRSDRGTCMTASNNIDHMLLYSPVIVELRWLVNLDFEDYDINDRIKILGYLNNRPIHNHIIILTEKVIHDSFKKKTTASIAYIQNEVKHLYYLEKYQKEKNKSLTKSGKD